MRTKRRQGNITANCQELLWFSNCGSGILWRAMTWEKPRKSFFRGKLEKLRNKCNYLDYHYHKYQ
jgi:hypothetical protein